MAISSQEVQKLREETGVAIMACKKALEEANGDFAKACELLKERNAMVAAKKADREASEGLIEAYIHGGGKIGVMVEVNCETDFVARNPEFKELAHDIALQISAMNPQDVEELLEQEFIKDPSVTINKLIQSKIAKLGENIKLKRFVRYSLSK
jgi:elongation factor Ts